MISNVAPVRWRRDEGRRGPVYPGLRADHPAVTVNDVLCGAPIGTEEPVQLLVVGPDNNNDEDRERHEAGRWYTALAVLVHKKCLARLSDDQVEAAVSELSLRRD